MDGFFLYPSVIKHGLLEHQWFSQLLTSIETWDFPARHGWSPWSVEPFGRQGRPGEESGLALTSWPFHWGTWGCCWGWWVTKHGNHNLPIFGRSTPSALWLCIYISFFLVELHWKSREDDLQGDEILDPRPQVIYIYIYGSCWAFAWKVCLN